MSVRPVPNAVATPDGFATRVRALLAVRMLPPVHERVVRLKRTKLATGETAVRWTRDAVCEKYGEEDFGVFEIQQVTAFRSDLQRG